MVPYSQPVLPAEPVPKAGLGVGPGRGQGGPEVPVPGVVPPAEGGRGLEAAASDRAAAPHRTPQRRGAAEVSTGTHPGPDQWTIRLIDHEPGPQMWAIGIIWGDKVL